MCYLSRKAKSVNVCVVIYTVKKISNENHENQKKEKAMAMCHLFSMILREKQSEITKTFFKA